MQEESASREEGMNRYGQVWGPWGIGLVLSLAAWALIIWAALALVGCAAFGAEHTVKLGKAAYPDTAPVPPPATIPECKDSASFMCCCDMSTKGILTCRCPHPGGVQ
jgi:hypothetical protein